MVLVSKLTQSNSDPGGLFEATFFIAVTQNFLGFMFFRDYETPRLSHIKLDTVRCPHERGTLAPKRHVFESSLLQLCDS